MSSRGQHNTTLEHSREHWRLENVCLSHRADCTETSHDLFSSSSSNQKYLQMLDLHIFVYIINLCAAFYEVLFSQSVVLCCLSVCLMEYKSSQISFSQYNTSDFITFMIFIQRKQIYSCFCLLKFCLSSVCLSFCVLFVCLTHSLSLCVTCRHVNISYLCVYLFFIMLKSLSLCVCRRSRC